MRDPRIDFTPGEIVSASAVVAQPERESASQGLMTTIQEVWAEILGLERVAVADDFFDLGGNSLIAGSAVAALSSRLGIDLPLRTIFAAPTPAEMADLILEMGAPPASGSPPIEGITPPFPDWLVPLQPIGLERPVWLVPGGVGGVWTLKRDAAVANHVGEQRPFFGFQRDPPQLDIRRPDWIAATAALYVAQMRAIQASGPYLIYGVCSGGPLAWEMASQLIAAGEAIAGILLYESALATDFATVRPRRRRPMPSYIPRSLPIDLTLLMTETWHASDRSAGWRQVAQGAVATVVMPGSTPGAHNLYVNREAMIAQHLREWIARSEAKRNS